ncbi:hypothetical protein GOQ04_21905 [Emticicia sp. ODNR4P]|nr:hypothetical protein [Emticicia sp. ODNR4P]
MSRKDLVYLSTLAKEHNLHLRSYMDLMAVYADYLLHEYQLNLNDYKGKCLPAWVVHLCRELNPSDFEINSMKEEGRFIQWLEWIGNIKNRRY